MGIANPFACAFGYGLNGAKPECVKPTRGEKLRMRQDLAKPCPQPPLRRLFRSGDKYAENPHFLGPPPRLQQRGFRVIWRGVVGLWQSAACAARP